MNPSNLALNNSRTNADKINLSKRKFIIDGHNLTKTNLNVIKKHLFLILDLDKKFAILSFNLVKKQQFFTPLYQNIIKEKIAILSFNLVKKQSFFTPLYQNIIERKTTVFSLNFFNNTTLLLKKFNIRSFSTKKQANTLSVKQKEKQGKIRTRCKRPRKNKKIGKIRIRCKFPRRRKKKHTAHWSSLIEISQLSARVQFIPPLVRSNEDCLRVASVLTKEKVIERLIDKLRNSYKTEQAQKTTVKANKEPDPSQRTSLKFLRQNNSTPPFNYVNERIALLKAKLADFRVDKRIKRLLKEFFKPKI